MESAAKRGRERALKIVDVLKKVKLEEVQLELNFMNTKWPAYLFMDPQDATRRFINEYRRVYKEYLRKVDSVQRATNALAINELALRKRGTEYTSVYRARQDADALGVEYGTYLRIAFDFWTRKKRKNLPRPSQLRMSKWPEAWRRKLEEEWPTHMPILGIPDLDEFRLDSYCGLPAQDRFREAAIEIAHQRRDMWKRRIEDLVVHRRQLPLEAFRGHVPDDLIDEMKPEIDEVLAESAPTSATIAKSPIDMQWQTCFVIPRDREQSQLPCHSCAQANGCRTVADAVEWMMKNEVGTTDPVREIKRNQNAERQRRWRENKKAKQRAGEAVDGKQGDHSGDPVV